VPKLAQYKSLEPFTLEELVESANNLLNMVPKVPKIQVNPRTVRYYISLGILPPPRGAPKIARYGYNHLVRLLGAKVLQEGGLRLDAINQGLEAWNKFFTISLEEMIQRWLDGEELVIAAPGMMEEKVRYNEVPSHDKIKDLEPPRYSVLNRSPGEVVRRIPLTSLTTLEISGDAELERELPRALRALEKIIREFS